MPGADDLLDRARRAASSGSYLRALGYLDRATTASQEPYVVARAEAPRAYVEAETGDPAAAIQRCLQVLDSRELDPVTEGKAWQQLGLMRMRTGEADVALDAFARAITVLPPGSDDLSFALLNRGNVYLQHGQPRQAAGDFDAARTELDKPGLELERAKAEHNLGYAQLLMGDLIGAMTMIAEAADVLSASSAINRATVEQDRAEILTAAGRPREAAQAREQAAYAYGSR